MTKRVFAIINCEDAPKWDGSAVLYQKLLEAAYGTDLIAIELFNAFENNLPNLNALDGYTGICLSGSHYSCYEDLPWIRNLGNFLQQYYALVQSENGRLPKLLGVCFGHQAIAHYLGGRAQKQSSSDNPHAGGNVQLPFTLRTTKIDLKPAFFEQPYVKQLLRELHSTRNVVSDGEAAAVAAEFTIPTLTMNASHGDAVTVLPSGAEWLATSDDAVHEMYSIGSQILCMQGHPELTVHHMSDLILPTVVSRGALSKEATLDSIESFSKYNFSSNGCNICIELNSWKTPNPHLIDRSHLVSICPHFEPPVCANPTGHSFIVNLVRAFFEH